MNAAKRRWALRYSAALRRHLASDAGDGLRAALRLGRQAGALGMKILDVAGIHGKALADAIPPGRQTGVRRRMAGRAKEFFLEILVPIERTHEAARRTEVRVRRLAQTLCRRAQETSLTVRNLNRGIARRRKAEAALRKSGQRHAALLAESQRLQRRLRRLARRILSAQEDERTKTGRHLQDEIAQALLAIHVRLLALKTAARTDTGNVRNEIDGTQHLVKEFARKAGRLARTLKGNHEA